MIEAHRLNILEQWKQTRFNAYMVYCSVTDNSKRAELYDFVPLHGDPTPEEREKIKQQEAEKRRASMNAIVQQLQAEWDQAVTDGKIPGHG